jgi:prepilin-type processing-associated H-X9-DG protein
MVDLLPFIEEGAVHNLYHYDKMFYAPENATAVATPLGIAVCPSTPRHTNEVQETFKLSQLAGARLAKRYAFVFDKLDVRFSGTIQGSITDYVIPVKASSAFANAHGYKVTDGFAELAGMFPLPTSEKALASVLPALVGPAEFRIEEKLRASQITDGLSHTLMMTEVAGRPLHWQRGSHVGTNEPLSCAWANPMGMACLIQGNGEHILQEDNAYHIYSFHPVGVNFLFADGHVMHLNGLTEPRIILAMLTPSHGEILGEFTD